MKEEQSDCPYIVFRIDANLYTISSANVVAIREMPQMVSMPHASKGVRGVFMYMDCAVPMIDLRTVLGKKTLDSEYVEFVKMLEQRKQDHYNWVDELNRSIHKHQPFRLATDPHKCAFGQWYYNFKSDNNAINHHMKKIEEPHRLLHEAALKATKCDQQHDQCKRETCIKIVLHDAEHVYAKAVVDLIEESKEVLKDSYREMALVIRHADRYYGISVDEVLSVETVEDGGSRDAAMSESPMVKAIKKSTRYHDELIIELDETNLLLHFGL